MARPSAAVLAARARAGGRIGLRGARKESERTKWFIEAVSNKIAFTLKNRVRLATKFVESKVIRNIAIAVEKTGTSVIRSKPGEYPRADTTQLLRTIFTDFKQPAPGVFDGFIGSPLDYSLILELKLNRSFLKRTMNEQRSTIIRILTGPIK